jgi:hypothetical protein
MEFSMTHTPMDSRDSFWITWPLTVERDDGTIVWEIGKIKTLRRTSAKRPRRDHNGASVAGGTVTGDHEAAAKDRGERRVAAWLSALESRHLASMSFPELRRALTALSALYVECRGARLERGDALGSAGKRAAFAFFYSALHFESVRTAVRGLGAGCLAPEAIVDLGCGTGVASAAWAIECGRAGPIEGIDRNGWALAEARWNWARLGLSGRTRRGDVASAQWTCEQPGIVVAYAANELDEPTRARLLDRLLAAARQGARLLVVEPLARRAVPWWECWAERIRRAGGREDLWRFNWQTTPTLALLDRAAGLDHRQTGARSLWLG